jgi:3-deoxy-D-manno-octulosonate 8-phosphate phosphatase KdsC-like HAD superfamily phosphatase
VDCDGVLTDGTLTIDHEGLKLFKSFHTRDVRAIRELVTNGYEVHIVSADDWGGLEHFAEKVGAEAWCSRDKVFDPLRDEPYIAVGDDAWDVMMLTAAELAFAPADADPSVLSIPGVLKLDTAGGRGVMAEVARRLLS